MIVLSVFSRNHVSARVVDSHRALDDVTYRIVVLNGLHLQTCEQLRAEFRGEHTTFIRSPIMLPIAMSYNLGLSVIPNRLDVLELQDDVVAPRDIVRHLVDSPYDVPAAWGIRKAWGDWCERFEGRFAAEGMDGLAYVDGKCLLLRAHVRQQLGYHCELFIKGVDADWGLRATACGFTVGHIEQPRIEDVGIESAAGNGEQVKRLHEHAHALARFLRDTGELARRYEPMHDYWKNCEITHGDAYGDIADGI